MKLDDIRFTIYLVEELRTLQKTLNRLDTAACNGFISPIAQQKNIDRRAQILHKAKDVAGTLGFTVYHQEDPRGCSLYLVDDTMDNSTYHRGMALG